MFLTAILDFAEKNDVRPSRFSSILCCSGDLFDNESEEKQVVRVNKNHES